MHQYGHHHFYNMNRSCIELARDNNIMDYCECMYHVLCMMCSSFQNVVFTKWLIVVITRVPLLLAGCASTLARE